MRRRRRAWSFAWGIAAVAAAVAVVPPQVTLPLLVLLLMVLVARRTLGYRQPYVGPRFAVGFCTRCGYDLRASSGRCPECGAGF